jgi:hypothetical protein
MTATALRTAAQSDYDILEQLNRDYIDAVQHSDVRRFDEILASDFLCSNFDGSLVDRAAFLKQTAKPVTISNLRAEDVVIRLFSSARELVREPAATSREHAHRVHQARRQHRRRPLYRCLGEARRALARGFGSCDAIVKQPLRKKNRAEHGPGSARSRCS